MKSAIMTAALAVLLVGVFGFLPAQEAEADGSCFDFTHGAGWIVSATGEGKAQFAFNAGDKTGSGSPLTVQLHYKDTPAALNLKALTIDQYVGFNCADEFGEPCFDRLWSGTAEVECATCGPGFGPFSGETLYLIEVIDNGEPGKGRDLLYIVTGNYIFSGNVLQGGNIDVRRASAAPGC